MTFYVVHFNHAVVKHLKLYKLLISYSTSDAFRLVSLYFSVAVTQLADVSVITTLLAFPVHKPKLDLHPEAIYH